MEYNSHAFGSDDICIQQRQLKKTSDKTALYIYLMIFIWNGLNNPGASDGPMLGHYFPALQNVPTWGGKFIFAECTTTRSPYIQLKKAFIEVEAWGAV